VGCYANLREGFSFEKKCFNIKVIFTILRVLSSPNQHPIGTHPIPIETFIEVKSNQDVID
jgi:hypothetical protein